MRWTTLLAGASLALAVGCSSGEREPDPTPDAGTTPDAGQPVPGPIPFPFVRMDDPQIGTSHQTQFQGVVRTHGLVQPSDVPASFGDAQPARKMEVRLVDSSVQTLYYTLPKGYAFAAFPNDQVRVFYRERAAGFGSSYAARVTTVTGALKALFEDGLVGSALDETERLGFTFQLDEAPLSSDEGDCGKRVHYGVTVQNGDRKKRLFGGQSEEYTLADGQVVTFTLFDAYRIEESSCGAAPEYSIAYFVQAKQ